MRIAAFVPLFAGLMCCAGPCQERGGVGGVESVGVSSSFSPDSSHILIGLAEQRKVWTLGAEFTYLLKSREHFRVDYEGSVMPIYEETDPTLLGTTVTIRGQTLTTLQTPARVVYVAHGPVGEAVAGVGSVAPIYAIFGTQTSYAAALAPLGVRVSAFPRWRIQPSLAIDLGFVVSKRDLPIDLSDQFNYMFSFGPGFQLFTSPNVSWRVEYIYRHTSNAGQGYQNPGVDQGVFRLTLSKHR